MSTCGTCQYWQPTTTVDKGTCHYNAPFSARHTTDVDGNAYDPDWPICMSNEWCGQWSTIPSNIVPGDDPRWNDGDPGSVGNYVVARGTELLGVYTVTEIVYATWDGGSWVDLLLATLNDVILWREI